ncbi:MAG: ATP-binding protein [Chloroflexi bacterium]|nr:ATP-binding protein [Chloroflexota bacterium]
MESNRLVLVAMAGLPGSGKSSIARRLAVELNICLLELDRIEKPLLERISGDTLGWGGYELLTNLAEDHLALGHSVILDCVTWIRPLRARWSDLASKYDAVFRPIEVRCSDEELHRSRLLERPRPAGWTADPPLVRAEEARRMYESWDTERLELDSVHPLDDLVRAAVDYVSG